MAHEWGKGPYVTSEMGDFEWICSVCGFRMRCTFLEDPLFRGQIEFGRSSHEEFTCAQFLIKTILES